MGTEVSPAQFSVQNPILGTPGSLIAFHMVDQRIDQFSQTLTAEGYIDAEWRKQFERKGIIKRCLSKITSFILFPRIPWKPQMPYRDLFDSILIPNLFESDIHAALGIPAIGFEDQVLNVGLSGNPEYNTDSLNNTHLQLRSNGLRYIGALGGVAQSTA